MIVFNEGVPGAGKSYDAVATHILPALKAGREVFARLNGLNEEAIAKHLKMSVEDVAGLLHIVTDEQVPNLPDIVTADSLVVIDEAHMYYVADRRPLDPNVEQFFAEHRHEGLDIILISQWYKRIHTALRARIERKAVFQKLTAVGLKKRYTVATWVTTSPDKYEKVGTQTKKYDPAIFLCYESVRAGTENLEVYTEGGESVWRKLGLYSLIMVPLVGASIYVVLKFFSGGATLVKDKPGVKTSFTQVETAPSSGTSRQGNQAHQSDSASPNAKPTPDYSLMPPAVGYLFSMGAQGRPRLAGLMYSNGGKQAAGIVEFREAQDHVMERLTLKQIMAMGVKVTIFEYGVKMTYEKATMIATNWPVDLPGTIDRTTQERVGFADQTTVNVSRTVSQPDRLFDDQRKASGEGRQSNRRAFPMYTPPGG